MSMKVYKKPLFDFIKVSQKDVITTSGDEPFFGVDDDLNIEDDLSGEIDTPSIPVN